MPLQPSPPQQQSHTFPNARILPVWVSVGWRPRARDPSPRGNHGGRLPELSQGRLASTSCEGRETSQWARPHTKRPPARRRRASKRAGTEHGDRCEASPDATARRANGRHHPRRRRRRGHRALRPRGASAAAGLPQPDRGSELWGRGSHSSTFQLNVSAFCGTGGAFMSRLGGI
jgi:hypothetical protein